MQKTAPDLPSSAFSESEHFVQFYETDEFLVDSLKGYIADGLQSGDACVVVATPAHRAGLEERLQEGGIDVAAACATGQYVALDAAETLATFMDAGLPDVERFTEAVGQVIRRAAKGWPRVRIFGEMVGLLWIEKNYDAATRLEGFWNDLHRQQPFTLFCGYPLSSMDHEAMGEPFRAVCAGHTRVIPAESYAMLSNSEERLQAVILLQRKAALLEAEIAERKRAQEALRRREAELTDFIENAALGMHWVGPDGIIQWANRAELEMLGYTSEEYIGRHISEFHVDQEVIRYILRHLADGEELHNYEARLKSKDGSIRYALISSNVYRENDRFIHTRCLTRDITERKRSEEVISHLAAIVESSDDAIVSKSLEGIIQSWNKGAERIFGYTAEEVIGKSILVLIPPDRVAEEPVILDRLRKGLRIDHFETVRVTKDGRRVDISLTVSPIKNKSGKIIGISKIARDISESKRAEAALRALKDELEAQLEERKHLLYREQVARAEAETANRMKDQFLATVSHELRTPLNAIVGWVHMLRRGNLEEAVRSRAIETIERNARTQAQLIEDILDVSRIITGKLRLNIGAVDMASVINAAIDSVQLAAESKGIRLEVTFDPSARHLSGDSSRLQQVIWNLLANAIKFTPPGGRVAVRLERAGNGAQIKVSDTGEGISRDFLPYIFDHFRQADGTSTRRHGGLGLGLAIVRHLVEHHGGTVSADSPGEGGGATFTISLPLAPSHQGANSHRANLASMWPDEKSNSSLQPLPSLEGIKVLLVDDDSDTLQMLTAILSECRAIVQTATVAGEALEMLQWYRPDVLVSDLAMPDEDGYSLISKVRALESESGMPIPAVALTAYVRVEDRARALSAGFNMFVAKPVEPNELIITIANLTDSGTGKLKRA